MTTAIEWAIANPSTAVSLLILILVWLILAAPGLWLWIDLGIAPLRDEWRNGWRYWPKRNFVEALVVTMFMALAWLIWLRVFLHLVGY
jgi:ABC-type sulfate transport system permease component